MNAATTRLDDWLQARVALACFDLFVGPDPRDAARLQGEVLTTATARPGVDYQALKPGDDVAARFRIEEKLGSGGFAVAYKVFDSYSDTARVLKIIIGDRRSTFERLKREYRLLERLKPHPNVVGVVWADRLPDETPYMVLEYVHGTGVSELLDSGVLSLEDVKRICKDTLAGLEHLHASGIFHRDIKPSNLLWTDQRVRIIDFNVAVHCDYSEVWAGGTRRYIPPDLELHDGLIPEEEVDRDLYGLGITLYECATRRYPWTEASPPPKAAARDPREYVGELAPEFAQVILRSIAPRRRERFTSATEFHAAINAIGTVRATSAARYRGVVAPPTASSFPIVQPTKPNFNPVVSHLLTMYTEAIVNNVAPDMDELV